MFTKGGFMVTFFYQIIKLKKVIKLSKRLCNKRYKLYL